MDKTTFTPEESLLLITQTIEDTKKRFKENGFIFIVLFWGILMFFVTLSQFILLQLESNKIIDFEYTIRNWTVFLYPLGGIYTYIYVWKKKKKNNLPKTIIRKILGALGALVGTNLMIFGFIISPQLGENLYPIFLVFLAFWTIIAGITINFKPLIIGGIILNLLGFVAFFIDWQYHSLIMSMASVIALIIPGILLNKENKNGHV